MKMLLFYFCFQTQLFFIRLKYFSNLFKNAFIKYFMTSHSFRFVDWKMPHNQTQWIESNESKKKISKMILVFTSILYEVDAPSNVIFRFFGYFTINNKQGNCWVDSKIIENKIFCYQSINHFWDEHILLFLVLIIFEESKFNLPRIKFIHKIVMSIAWDFPRVRGPLSFCWMIKKHFLNENENGWDFFFNWMGNLLNLTDRWRHVWK